MQISIRRDDTSLLFVLSGELTWASCQNLRDEVLSRLGSSCKEIYLDLRDLSVADSAGLGLFMGIKMSCTRSGTRLQLVEPAGNVLETLRKVQFDRVFDLLPAKDFDRVAARFQEEMTAT